jgi:hypothetical protein
MAKEKDLVIGKAKEGEEETQDMMMEFEEVRANIETAQFTWSFLDQMDLESPENLTFGLTDDLRESKKKCLEIIMNGIDFLHANL